MTRFFRESRNHLLSNGRMPIFFGTSGDLGYLRQLVAQEHFTATAVALDTLDRDGWTVEYLTFLLRGEVGARRV